MEIENQSSKSASAAQFPNVVEMTRLSSGLNTAAEPPSIRLSPEQIEEIHTDEYSLALFYATRIEPKSIPDLKREFPEPETGKALSVMDRYLKVGLVHLTQESKYYSNFPTNYINYSNYRYDNDLEARKDEKVFALMKEHTGDKIYWRNKTYFSMDMFYSEDQTAELIEMFKAIKLKAKQFANENADKKTTKGLKFRRMKFYDMTFAIFLAFATAAMITGAPAKSFAGGNDPALLATNDEDTVTMWARSNAGGGGNDPTLSLPGYFYFASAKTPDEGGGGHDPNQPTLTTDDGGGGHDPGQSTFARGKVESLLRSMNLYRKFCWNNESSVCSALKNSIDRDQRSLAKGKGRKI